MYAEPAIVWNAPVSPKSRPGRSVARYRANAAAATTAAHPANLTYSGCALGGDDGTDLFDCARVQHVPRLHPAAPRHGDAQLHLPVEHVGAVAVAVDRHHGAGGDGAPRECAIQVEMRRRSEEH